jgi:hypothetical protein
MCQIDTSDSVVRQDWQYHYLSTKILDKTRSFSHDLERCGCNMRPNCYIHIHTYNLIIKTKRPNQFKAYLTYSEEAGQRKVCTPWASRLRWVPLDEPARGQPCCLVVLPAVRLTAGGHSVLPGHTSKHDFNNGNLLIQSQH